MAYKALAWLVLICASHSALSAETPPAFTSLCDIVARPAAYDGKVVRIRASVLSDGIERTVLTDLDCPGLGIVPESVGPMSKVPGMSELQNAIYRGVPGTTDKHIEATFTGAFDWRPTQPLKRVLRVTAVSEMIARASQ